MDEQQFPQPPDDLVLQWDKQWHKAKVKHCSYAPHIANQAAKWGYQQGADAELEACLHWAAQFNYDDYRYQDELRAVRRPESIVTKKGAIETLDSLDSLFGFPSAQYNILLRALEQLPSES